ncbi:MAG TPA: hypothetical protein VGK73_30300 [Polyangiaceae bacterium]
MTEAEEKAYVEGSRAMWRQLLAQALRELGYEENRLAGAAKQLEETRAVLRRVCAEHGDNDWSDDLHLADVVEKHLERHISAAR